MLVTGHRVRFFDISFGEASAMRSSMTVEPLPEDCAKISKPLA